MKLTDFLQDVGRPVAYYPSLRKITGSTNATILLCQFIYWRGKESDPNGWLYKTAEDIEQETGLSYGEQKTARRDLIAAGLLEEYYARLDHQMRFRLLLEAINEKWGTIETSIPESGKPQFGNDGNTHSLMNQRLQQRIHTLLMFLKKKDRPNRRRVQRRTHARRCERLPRTPPRDRKGAAGHLAICITAKDKGEDWKAVRILYIFNG